MKFSWMPFVMLGKWPPALISGSQVPLILKTPPCSIPEASMIDDKIAILAMSAAAA